MKKVLCLIASILTAAVLIIGCGSNIPENSPAPTLVPTMAPDNNGGSTDNSGNSGKSGGAVMNGTDNGTDNNGNPVQGDPGVDSTPQRPNSTALPGIDDSGDSTTDGGSGGGQNTPEGKTGDSGVIPSPLL